jgi:hypothetical protein
MEAPEQGEAGSLKPTEEAKPHGKGHYRYRRDWYCMDPFDAFKWQEESQHVKEF